MEGRPAAMPAGPQLVKAEALKGFLQNEQERLREPCAAAAPATAVAAAGAAAAAALAAEGASVAVGLRTQQQLSLNRPSCGAHEPAAHTSSAPTEQQEGGPRKAEAAKAPGERPLGSSSKTAASLERLCQLRDRCLLEASKLPPLENVHFDGSLDSLSWCGVRPATQPSRDPQQQQHKTTAAAAAAAAAADGAPQKKAFSVLSLGFQEARRRAAAWTSQQQQDDSGAAAGTAPPPAAPAAAGVEAEAATAAAAREAETAAAAAETAAGAETTTAAAATEAEAAAADVPAGRRPGRPRKSKERGRDAAAREAPNPKSSSLLGPFPVGKDATVSLLRDSLGVMLEDLIDLCSPRPRSALTPEQRRRFYEPLKAHAKHIQETKDVRDLIGYMRLYFDRYMVERIVPSEDSSYARVFALLNALAVCPPPCNGVQRCMEAPKAINLGCDACAGNDLMEDVLSDRSSSLGTDQETQQQQQQQQQQTTKGRPLRLMRTRAAKKRRFF
ncbi:hypothetical protein Esti_006450 [Eimeria stiedai]